MIIPESLKKGDRITIVSPAGKIDHFLVYKAKYTLEENGFEVIIGEHALGSHGRYSGTREERLSDFINALEDKQTKAILCSRGGYGAIHLIEDIPESLIKDNPKWLIGYSDITLLHALFSKAGVCSLHAPMCKHLMEAPDNYSSLSLLHLLTNKPENFSFDIANDEISSALNRQGIAKGHICGGNFAVLSALHGTPYDFNYNKAILFIEDIAESPYKIERMLYTLKLSGVFDRIAGLIVGQFTDCNEDPEMGETINQMIRRIVTPYEFPVCFNFPAGHTLDNLPMTEGAIAELNISLQGTKLTLL